MKHARRWKLSAAQRADMWNRWKAGQSLHEIGRALGKDHVVIQLLLARHGGIAPAARRRSRRLLTLAEREDISRGIAIGSSMRVIAQRLRRACSTVSREVARHGGRAQYRANEADQRAWESALRPKPCLLATHRKLQEIVASRRKLATLSIWKINRIQKGLKMDLSQIVSELKKERNRIDRAIAALNGLNGTNTQRAAKTSSVKPAAIIAKRRGHLTVEGRKRLSAMMKKRWAERRKRGAAGRKAA